MTLEIEQSILVVDDDEAVRRLLRRCFEREQYSVYEAATGPELFELLANRPIDLITLDLTLGNENGLELARDIRKTSDVPIIMVSGKGDLIDTVVGLEVGADDYIAKPFELREVIARTRAVLRRHEKNKSPKLSDSTPDSTAIPHSKFEFFGWVLDTDIRELRNPANEVCELTTGEYDLLVLFLTKARRVLSRDQMMNELKGNEWLPNDRTIDNQVARLRKKLIIPNDEQTLIKTIRGTGYMFTAEVHSR